MMGANMKCDKRSVALLSNKRTKAYTRTKADEVFALPSFSDAMPTVVPIAETMKTEYVYSFSDHAAPAVLPFFSVEPPKSSTTPAHYCNRPDHGMEQLKQTMIHQESLFKEQLGELHRLYQVQKSLMSEWGRKGAAAVYPQPDPPFLHSSLSHTADVTKGKNSLHEPNNFHVSEVDVNRTTPLFFPTRVDMNKPFEEIEGQKGNTVRRPLFDLEQPAEVYVDESEEEKSSSQLRKKPLLAETESKGSSIFNQRLKEDNVYKDSSSNGVHERYGQSSSDGLSDSKCMFPPAGLVSARTIPGGSSLNGSPLFPEQASSTVITHSGGNPHDCTTDSFTHPCKQQPRTLQNGQKRSWLSGDDINNSNNNHETSSKLPHWLLQASSEVGNGYTSRFASFTSNGKEEHTFFPQKHKGDNQCGSFLSFPGGIVSNLTTGKHPNRSISSETNIQVLPPKESPNNCSGFFVTRGVQEIQRAQNTFTVDAPFFASFASRGVEETQRAPNALTVNAPSYTHIVGDQVRGVPQTSLTGQLLIDGHTSMIGTPHPQTMFLDSEQSQSSSRMPLWLQPKLQQSSNVQQPFKPTIPMQHVTQLDVPDPQNNNQLQKFMMLNANNTYTSQLNGTAEVLLTPWSDIHAKRNDLSATSNVEQKILSHTLQMKNTPEVHEYVETRSFKNGQKNGKTDGLNASKIGFDLNVLSDELSDENVVEAAPKESSGLYAKLGIKISAQNGRKTLQNGLNFEGNCSFDCSAKVISGVTNAVKQVLDDCSQFSNGTAENTGCGSDAGSHYEGVKSSDGSGLTSESQDAVPLALMKAIEDSNASSGDHSGDSMRNVVTTFAVDMQLNERIGMLCEEACKSIRSRESLRLPNSSTLLLHDLNEEYVVLNERESSNVALSSHALEAAEVLFRLGSDFSMIVAESACAPKNQEMSLNWLADMVSEEESYRVTGMDVSGIALGVMEVPARCSEPSFVDAPEAALDLFELAVLSSKPIMIEDIKLNEPPLKISDPVEESNPVPNPRRRSSRRGKTNKDFQRDVLPNMACLSRQEVSEDLQIIEGLIKSTTETTERCDSHKDEGSLVRLETGSGKHIGRGSAKGTKSCKGTVKQNPKVSLKVCSWGESTRRKRMRRQRSQWPCLPPGVL